MKEWKYIMIILFPYSIIMLYTLLSGSKNRICKIFLNQFIWMKNFSYSFDELSKIITFTFYDKL